MGTDRARVSYDNSRQYRTVVAQQGRVTLEADWNEAQQIQTEETRKEALDFVGPNGTPNNGYKVEAPGTPPQLPFDFTVDPGTMYVGGIRSYLAQAVAYSGQADWLDADRAIDPDWIDLSTFAQNPPQHEFTYLLLREQEVSAVEDTALKDRALGGPDTAQRSRLVQHIVRLATDASDCAGALTTAQKDWANKGLSFDPVTMRLNSAATLQVGFKTQVSQPDPCEPQAEGGYLGAENQLIRVQISDNGKFVWGFDNASFLYRVTVVNNTILQLQSSPVDQSHQPKSGQTVEVLRSAAKLSDPDPKVPNDLGNYIVSPRGFVVSLAADYGPTSKQIVLAQPIPPDYLNQPAPLFLRVWEEEKSFTVGTAVDLGDTEVQVTLQLPAGKNLHIGEYWMFAVRPSSPTDVYPRRYLDAPQPSEGPHLWVCPLAVIQWTNGILGVSEDCRNPFDNVVGLTKRKTGSGCCSVTVSPADLTGGKTLQSIIDQFQNQDQIAVCLMPGVYELPKPLRLGQQHSNLTMEACHDGVVLQAAQGAEAKFLDGMIVLNRADNVTLRGLRFELPRTPLPGFKPKLTGLDPKLRDLILKAALMKELIISIGVRPLGCSHLRIDSCNFHFAAAREASIVGFGIFAESKCSGLSVQNCEFRYDGDSIQAAENLIQMVIGIFLVPSVTFQILGREANGFRVEGKVIPSLLDGASLRDNMFTQLSGAAFVYAEPGAITIQNNTVRSCYAGFLIYSLLSLAFASKGALARTTREKLASGMTTHAAKNEIGITLVPELPLDPLVLIAGDFGREYPLPPEFDPVGAGQITVQVIVPPPQVPPDLGVLTGFYIVHYFLSAVERKPFQEIARKLALRLRLDASHNAIEAVPTSGSQSGTPSPSGSALLVFDDRQAIGGEVVVSANTIHNNTPKDSWPTATLILPASQSTVTGNLIANENSSDGKPCLGITSFFLKTPDPIVAVTGNILHGAVGLPPRPIPAPLDTWDILNTVLP